MLCMAAIWLRLKIWIRKGAPLEAHWIAKILLAGFFRSEFIRAKMSLILMFRLCHAILDRHRTYPKVDLVQH